MFTKLLQKIKNIRFIHHLKRRLYDDVKNLPINSPPEINFSLAWTPEHPTVSQIFYIFKEVFEKNTTAQRHFYIPDKSVFYEMEFFISQSYIFLNIKENIEHELSYYHIFKFEKQNLNVIKRLFSACYNLRDKNANIYFCFAQKQWVDYLLFLYHKPCEKKCHLCKELREQYHMNQY